MFPFRKWLSILHFMVVAGFSLLESAVPTGMVCSLAKVTGVEMGEVPKLKI